VREPRVSNSVNDYSSAGCSCRTFTDDIVAQLEVNFDTVVNCAELVENFDEPSKMEVA